MGYKIFVSYKYKDNSVYPISNSLYGSYLNSYFSTVRDYVDKLELYMDHSNNIYKGESDNEDLSNYSDDYIWSKLKDRIYDSSVTIVMISPGMKERYRLERSQWIPWEISYSLKEMTRGDRTSHSNAILAVVLPDRNHDYSYFSYRSYDDCVFSIIRKNMNNRISNGFGINSFASQYSFISTDDSSYIPSVKWEDFILQPMRYIETAVNRKNRIYEYSITKEV